MTVFIYKIFSSETIVLNEEGDTGCPRFEIKKFYANVITIDEDEMALNDM